MLTTIAKPFGWILKMLYLFFNNYGWAVILFALIVRLILMPLSMKSKRSTLRTTRLTPRLKELEKKYEGNKEKYNEEVQRIYKDEGINPMSGCLWSLIPFPILLALYYAIRYPITTMMGVAQELYEGPIAQKLTELGYTLAEGMSNVYGQISEAQFISTHFEAFSGISDKLLKLNFNFLGVDLGMTPSYKVWEFGETGLGMWLQIGLFLLPVLSAGLSLLSSVVTQRQSSTSIENDSTASTMKSMMIMMPIISLWIGFTTPGALSLYWASSTLFSMIQEVVLYRKYKKEFDALDAERLEQERIREEELERKRTETERLRAENATQVNPNTSKRKRQTAEKQVEQERRRIEELEKKKESGQAASDGGGDESRVGKRKFARGRAYAPDRYVNPGDEAPEYDAPTEEEPALLGASAEDMPEDSADSPEDWFGDDEYEDEEALDEEGSAEDGGDMEPRGEEE